MKFGNLVSAVLGGCAILVEFSSVASNLSAAAATNLCELPNGSTGCAEAYEVGNAVLITDPFVMMGSQKFWVAADRNLDSPISRGNAAGFCAILGHTGSARVGAASDPDGNPSLQFDDGVPTIVRSPWKNIHELTCTK